MSAGANFAEKCKLFFQEADKNGDGLSIGELAKVIRKVATIEIADSEIANMFLDLDDNSDKTISWEEFTEVFMKKNPKQIQKSELKEAFENIDTDNSGVLSIQEIKAQYAKIGMSISDEDFEKTLSSADKNKDGKIDYKEFLNLMA